MQFTPEAFREILTAAATIALDYFDRPIDVEVKGDGSPATAADRRIDTFLRTALGDLLPEACWLSEETVDTGERLGAEWTWVVDPLDGTKEFVQGVPEFGISVGLVHGNEVVAGGVTNPATGEYGLVVEGSAPEFGGIVRHTRPVEKLGSVEAIVSRSEVRRGEIVPYEPLFSNIRPVGSVAYKLLRVAAGAEYLTFSVQPKHEWDICGGVALIRGVGMSYLRFDGLATEFNQAQPLVVSGAVAGPDNLVRQFMRLSESIRSGPGARS